MSKINLDKYYTSSDLAKYCVLKTQMIIGIDNITEYLEPSAGNGVFLDYLPSDTLVYDIEPEGEHIIKQDYLTLDLDYKKGRCVIGNPPYGSRNTMSVKFFKKSIQIADYIAFILPISQLDNNQQMYEFDLVYSENLGERFYSDRKILCCFNIYKRPINCEVNKKLNYKLQYVEVIEYRRNGTYKKPIKYDFGMCAWGASLGKEVDFVGQYAQENYIIINNSRYRKQVLDIMLNTNWKDLYPYVATPKIQTWKIYKYIKEQISEIQ